MRPELNNSFCYYPFYQLAVKDFNGSLAEVVAPCCNMLGFDNPFDYFKKDQKETFQEYFYSKPMKKLRNDLLAGKKPECCNSCWVLEKTAKKSIRLHSNCDMPTDLDFNYENPKLTTIDLSTGRNCNLSCRMCSPGSSNKLDKEYLQMSDSQRDILGWSNIKRLEDNRPENNIAWQNFLSDQGEISVVKAIGGEPFITPDFINMLDAYIKSGKAKTTELVITTNATKFNTKNMKLLNHFKHIRLLLSIDATEKDYEYIRHPMPWKKLVDSVKNFKNKVTTSYEMIITTPVMLYNIMSLEKLSNWAESIEIDYIYLDTVQNIGRGIDIKHFSKKLLNKVYVSLQHKENIKGPGLEYIKFNTQNAVENRHAVLKELEIFDSMRNQTYREFLPKSIVGWLDGE